MDTPEPFWVEKVTSPTDQLSQVVVVYIGNGEQITVTTESGAFTARGDFGTFPGPPAKVEITLLPNTVHHLEVTAKVRRIIDSNGCTYGDYTLRTTTDRMGTPLVIVQEGALPQPGLIIQGDVRLNDASGPGLPDVRIYRSYASYPGDVVATTDQAGHYETEFAYIPGDEMVTVRAEKEGYTFDPPQYYWRHYHGREVRTLNFIAHRK